MGRGFLTPLCNKKEAPAMRPMISGVREARVFSIKWYDALILRPGIWREKTQNLVDFDHKKKGKMYQRAVSSRQCPIFVKALESSINL